MMKPFDKNETPINWEQDYPRMPALFHQAVTEELRRHLENDDLSSAPAQSCAGSQSDSPSDTPSAHTPPSQESLSNPPIQGARRKRLSRILLLPLAAVLLGFTALAGSGLWHTGSYPYEETLPDPVADFQLCRSFPWELNTPEAAAAIQTNPRVTVLTSPPEFVRDNLPEDYDALPNPVSAPLLDIKEILYDGNGIYLYAETTEVGKQYMLFINDAHIDQIEFETVPFYIHEASATDEAATYSTEGLPNSFVFHRDFSPSMTGDFQFLLVISIYESLPDAPANAPFEEKWRACQNQYLTFPVKVSQPPADIPDQRFSYEEFTLEFQDLSYSIASQLKGIIHLYMTEDQFAAYQEYPTPGRHFTIQIAAETASSSTIMKDPYLPEVLQTEDSSLGVLPFELSVTMENIAEGFEWPLDTPISSSTDHFTFRIMEQTLGVGGTVTEETVYGEDELTLKNAN